MVYKRNADTQRDQEFSEQEPAPCLVLTPDLVVQQANDAYLKAIVRSREEIVGRSIFDALPVKNADGDVTVIFQPGGRDAAPAQRSPQDLAEQVRRLQASNDQLRQQRDQLAARALRDPLTGALSRSVFHEELARALSRRSREPRTLAVLFLDLDRLKQVNDWYGHAAGDELIRQTVERMSAGVRPSDAIARMGGDEFVVLLDDLQSPEEAEAVAERLLAKISEPYLLAPGALVYGSASVGIALADTTALTADELLSHADAAMYKAKQSGRGRWELFDAAAYTAANARLQLETELRAAIPDDQLLLHYQPIFNLNTGEPAAVEALLRWRHPSRGVLAADAFIEVAEDSGVLADIGPWVIEEACRQLAAWDRTLGSRAPKDIYVNLSVGELVRPQLNDCIAAAARRANITMDRLVIEVTESGMLDTPGSVTDAVDQLLQLGCRVAIDDFGTGYSALSRLVELPADILKIDRSFVRGLSSGPEAAAVIAAVLLLAHNLRKTVVAEGVEDAAALATLSELGCEHAQGYFLGRPQPANEITEQLMRPNLVLA
jgi:diguanylate cyclase (GGDEF)-like protein